MYNMPEHERLVATFLSEQRATNPERYKSVCAKHPTKSRKAMLRVKQREITVGLLGLQPETGLSNYVAQQHGFEVGYADE